jgi:hypothetical protein
LWPGFGRWRSLAICFELLGQFEEALVAYQAADAPLRGDALIALGRLEPLLEQSQAAAPWQTLWQAYRAHALCLAGRVEEATTLACSLVPVDVYEWVHVFEALLRAGRLGAVDLRSVLYRPPLAAEHRWSALARQRMRLDYLRVTTDSADLCGEYEKLIEDYDRGGLPFERCLTRLSYSRWLLAQARPDDAVLINAVTLNLARRYRMTVLAVDALELVQMADDAETLRVEIGYKGPRRP